MSRDARPASTCRGEVIRRCERTVASKGSVYLIVLLGLQIFLLTMALDTLLGYDPPLASASAVLSVVLAIESALFYRAMCP